MEMIAKKRVVPLWRVIVNWFDNDAVVANDHATGDATDKSGRHIDWARVLPFVALHLGCFAVVYVGTSTTPSVWR